MFLKILFAWDLPTRTLKQLLAALIVPVVSSGYENHSQ